MGYDIAALLILGAIALIAGGLYGAYRVGYRDGYRQRIEDSPLGVVSDAFDQLARAISGCGVKLPSRWPAQPCAGARSLGGDLEEGDGEDGEDE